MVEYHFIRCFLWSDKFVCFVCSLWALGKCGSVQPIVDLLQDMSSKNIDRDTTTYAASLWACDRNADASFALQLLIEMEVYFGVRLTWVVLIFYHFVYFVATEWSERGDKHSSIQFCTMGLCESGLLAGCSTTVQPDGHKRFWRFYIYHIFPFPLFIYYLTSLAKFLRLDIFFICL